MKVVLFDTETTDLMPNSVIALQHRPHIIEFYAMKVEYDSALDGWELKGELDFFCKPPVPITDEVQRITGIKPEDVADAPPFRVKADTVQDFFADADEVVAHNLSYDMAVVESEFERLQRGFTWPEGRTCTVEATEHLKGHRLKLADLYELLFEERFTGAHRAKVDVEAMFRCWTELRERGEL